MTYQLLHTDGTFLGNIGVGLADGINNTVPGNPTYPLTNLVLFGENFSGYGLPMNENFVKLLENSASATPPVVPLLGQLWWDKTNHVLKVYNGSTWYAVNGGIPSATQPTGPTPGEMWWDTVAQEVKVYSGTVWEAIGGGGNVIVSSPANTITVTDSVYPLVTHNVTAISINGIVVTVLSNDAAFSTTDPQIPGFTSVGPGINILPGSFYNGLVIPLSENLAGGTVGSLPYQSAGNTTSMLGIGATNQVLTVSGGLPTWANSATQVYPAAGIPNSTGTSWASSFSTVGSGNIVLDTNPTIKGNITLTSELISNVAGTAFGTSMTSIDSFNANSFRSAKYVISVSNGSNYQTSEILLMQNGSLAYMTIYGEVSSTGSPFITFSANVSGGITSLWASGTSLGNVAKILKMYVAV